VLGGLASWLTGFSRFRRLALPMQNLRLLGDVSRTGVGRLRRPPRWRRRPHAGTPGVDSIWSPGVAESSGRWWCTAENSPAVARRGCVRTSFTKIEEEFGILLPPEPLRLLGPSRVLALPRPAGFVLPTVDARHRFLHSSCSRCCRPRPGARIRPQEGLRFSRSPQNLRTFADTGGQ